MEGNVWSAGNNSVGQLGLGDYENITSPEKITSLPTIITIAAGNFHSLFLDSNGNVWSVGYNNYGQLGDTTNRTSPQQITSFPQIRLPRDKGKVPTKSARNI